MMVGPVNDVETDASSQQDILTDPNGYDGIAGLTGSVPNIPYLAPGGGSVSVRLGNSAVNFGTEYLSYPITVTSANNTFSYQYAVVLEHPQNHTQLQQPRFTVTIYDSLNNPLPGPCGNYSIDGSLAASDSTFFPFFQINNNSDTLSGFYKKWANVVVDLSNYVGQTMTIRFVTQDCTLGAHFGYAYIDATCLKLMSHLPYCQNDSVGSITAPAGFNSYQWYDNSGNAIAGATGVTLYVTNPVPGATYTVIMQSSAGCANSLTGTLTVDSTTAIYHTLVTNISCFGAHDGSAFINQTAASGSIIYTWKDSIGTVIPTSSHPNSPDSLVNAAPGLYTCTVQTPGGCMATDTFRITQPLPILAHATTPICPNEPQVALYAPGGTNYQWYDAGNNLISNASDSLYIVQSPALGQAYTVHFSPLAGCPYTIKDSFYLYRLNHPPTASGSPTCYGYGTASMGQPTSHPAGVTGPYTYNWVWAGNSVVLGTTASINNLYAGTYYVTAISPYGCSILDTIVVTQQTNPYDSLKLTTKYCPDDNPIVLHAPTGYSTYAWYESGNTIGTVLSTYDSLIISPPSVGVPYTVELQNPVSGRCNIILNTMLDYSLPPAIPGFITSTNVFTPNDDGINDYFLLNQNSYKYIKDFHIEVFNRWGRKVFETNDLSSQWDGKINGLSASEGVYYWIASYTQACLLNAPVLTTNGFVQILK